MWPIVALLTGRARVAEARAQLEASRADVPKVAALADDLRRIEAENHITERMHKAFRGDPNR